MDLEGRFAPQGCLGTQQIAWCPDSIYYHCVMYPEGLQDLQSVLLFLRGIRMPELSSPGP